MRAHRPRPRTLDLAPGEVEYLRGHWAVLSRLTEALRSEPTVRLAVLYGSTARGEERSDSDYDVLVDLRDEAASTSALARRLGEAVDGHVDVARLSRVRSEAPFLLLQALHEGRVLADREGVWPALQAQRETIGRAARRQLRRSEAEAAERIAELLEDV